MEPSFDNYTNDDLINEYKNTLSNKLVSILDFLDNEFDEAMARLKYDQSQQTERLYSFISSHPKFRSEVIQRTSIFFIMEEKKEQANLILQYKTWKLEAKEQYKFLLKRLNNIFI